MAWVETVPRRGVRERCLDGAVPRELSLELAEHRELLARWVRGNAEKRSRTSLLKDAGSAGIERAEVLCERLLRAGWIRRQEHLVAGSWRWEWIFWRDLARLQELLGVSGKVQRDAERGRLLGDAQDWLRTRREARDEAALDPELLDELAAALEELASQAALRLDVLATRLQLLRAIAAWHDAGVPGLRRDFALHACGDTKAIGAADWRWLASSFDLERLRIAQFAPMLWLAGDASLHWGEQRIDLGPLHVAGLPLADILRVDACAGVRGYWIVENRASFERQAPGLAPGQLLVWVPGRPAEAWTRAVDHLLRLAPAPAQVSADADPAGVDIACTVGALWTAQGLAWEPHRMGLAEWGSTRQRWALNEHDHALLQRLLARSGLHPALRALCEAMQREGRKAEQESWL